MIDRLRSALATAREVVAEFEPGDVDARQAAEFVDVFAELERVSNAGRTLAGPQHREEPVVAAAGLSNARASGEAASGGEASGAATTGESGSSASGAEGAARATPSFDFS